MAPKLPRRWVRDSVNILNTRDGNLYLYANVNPGTTVERIRFHYRIYGRINESDLEVPFDAYYIGIRVVDNTVLLPAQSAWTQRNTVRWLWWEGAHFTPVMGVGTPGQARIFYPDVDTERDIRVADLWPGPNTGAVVFAFARSGGAVLTEQRVNVVASILLLGQAVT